MTREENEGYIANMLRLREVGQMTKFQRWGVRSVQDLWCTLYGRQSSGIDKFLAMGYQ